jgi:hypothetical protein
MAGSLLIEMGEVVRAAPRTGATATEIAAWYLRKAQLLDHVADDTGGADAATARNTARKARQRASAMTARTGRQAISHGAGGEA